MHSSALLRVSVREFGNFSQPPLHSAREWECGYRASLLQQVGLCFKYSYRMALCILLSAKPPFQQEWIRRLSLCCKVDLKSDTKRAFSLFQGFFFPPLYPPRDTHIPSRLEGKNKARFPHEETPAAVIAWVLSSHLTWWGL